MGISRGIRRSKRKVMKTRKQFVQLMEGKGKTAAWAEKEFDRRRTGATQWKCGNDEETQLPTVQCNGSEGEEVYSDEFNEDAVELETKQLAATSRNVDMLLEEQKCKQNMFVLSGRLLNI